MSLKDGLMITLAAQKKSQDTRLRYA